MKRNHFLFWLVILLFLMPGCAGGGEAARQSLTYYIDAGKGDDTSDGRSVERPWKTFAPLNGMELGAGDRVEIAAGEYHETLMPQCRGRAGAPVVLSFGKGRFDFFPDRQHKRKFHISNTNGAPDEPKSIAIFLERCAHVRLTGSESDLYMRGKMIEVVLERSRSIVMEGLRFDYHRPTVSEFTVVSSGDNHLDVEVHPDSAFRILEKSRLEWFGEGWECVPNLTQAVDAARERVRRGGRPYQDLRRIEKRGDRRLRFHLIPLVKMSEKERVKAVERRRGVVGQTFQFRNGHRDCVGFFFHRSREVEMRDCAIHFTHGMGVVSQFSENLTFRDIEYAPRKGSGRVGAAWADMLHFSGCRGKVRVEKVHFSGSQDDAINIHGTYLRIVEKSGPRKLRLRFMHKQTYGFLPFVKGDEINFVSGETLLPFGENRVAAIERVDEKEFLLTLEHPAPVEIAPLDVVENVTWAPDVEIRDCLVEMTPTRGFLITTRGKVLVENNRFLRPHMFSILIAADARSWFESGAVKDVVIQNNEFLLGRWTPIRIHPEARKRQSGRTVHRNIRIRENLFVAGTPLVLDAENTGGLVFEKNRIKSIRSGDVQGMLRLEHCPGVRVEGNVMEK